METEATVLAALEVLYQKHLQPEQQQAADAYLRSFQLTPEAFGVCVALLDRFLPQCVAVVASAAQQQQQAQLVPILFFASQTLANKLRRQHAFPDRSTWSHLTWSEKIIAWLAVPHTAVPKLVQTQLVLALVACLPRIPRADLEAHLALPGNAKTLLLLTSSTAATYSGGAIKYVLNELTHARVASSIVTELLIVLVEEVTELQDRSARERLQDEINAWAAPVLDELLPQIMHDAVASPATQQLVIRAVRNWLRYSLVSPALVVRNPLVQSLLAFLNQDDLFDVTVDLVVELVRCYDNVERDAELIQWLVPQLMTLRSAFQTAVRDDDADRCLGLCRIFTEMAESYIPLLLGDGDMGQAAVVDLLLDCMSVPDVEIADVTVPFWLRFIEELLRLDTAARASKLATLAPSLLRLASTAMQHIQFTPGFPTLPADKQQDVKAFRHELGDILRDVCELVGVEPVVQHCVRGLEHIFALSPELRRWEAVEAHLFCFRSIARHVERAPAERVTASIELIFTHLPQFSEHPAICYTSCLIVARYVEWLRAHPAFLPAQLEFLNQNVMRATQDASFGDWEVARAAAAAVRAIATDCWDLLGHDITAFYLHIETHAILAVDDQTFILEGMLLGVRATRDLDAIQRLLDEILEPIGHRLGALFAAAPGTARSSVALGEMARLICIYDNLDIDMSKMTGGASTSGGQPQHPLMTLTERVWPLFNELLALFRTKDDLVERVCRCYKRILRTCGRAFEPYLPQLVDNLLACYQREPKSSYLYAANMVLKYYARDASDELLHLLAKLLRAFAETTFSIFQTRATLEALPDVVEEFFFLMQRAVTTVPHVLFAAPAPTLLDSLVQCALVSLGVSHNDANKAALCFLEDTLAQGLAAAATPSIKLAGLEPALQQILFGSDGSCGQRLVNQLLAGIVLSAVPASRLEADYGSVAGVLVQFAKLDGQRLQEWMAAWFTDAVAAAAGFLTLDDARTFQHELFTSPNERTFRRIVRHFGKLCASRNTSLSVSDAT